MTKHLQLKAAPEKRSPCEAEMRYDVMLDNIVFDTLYFNLTGYVGTLPTPEGGNLSIGEASLATYKNEIRRLNTEWSRVNIKKHSRL